MAEELPLFLLNTVLFPRMALPLRVFEPRYRELVDFCMAKDRTFGVLLIRSGKEVGGPAEPFEVGTTALIREVQQLPDGTLGLNTVGIRRFRLFESLNTAPFPSGLVEYLDDTPHVTPPDLLAEATEVAKRCLQLVLALNNEWVREIEVPGEPEALSYLIGARLPLGLEAKQRLLEVPNAAVRLQQELPLLKAEKERLTQLLQERAWLLSATLN